MHIVALVAPCYFACNLKPYECWTARIQVVKETVVRLSVLSCLNPF
jgi:hypothetical protein